MSIPLPRALAGLVLLTLSACDPGGNPDAGSPDAGSPDAGVAPRDAPHWAIVGLRHPGDERRAPQEAPPATVVTVTADRAFELIAITESYDDCAGDASEATEPCCVERFWPEVHLDGDELLVMVRVSLSLDVPCNGAIGPMAIPVPVRPLPPGEYRLVGLGRADMQIADLAVPLRVE